MAMSSGVRQGAVMAAGWALVGAAAPAVLYFAEIGPGLATASSHATAPSHARAAEPTVSGGPVVELRAGAFGQFRAQAEINGRRVDVLLDSGASLVLLSHADAERAGLRFQADDYTERVGTANGPARVAPLILDRISIGDITVRDVKAAVSEPGKLGQSLLGMTFLGRLTRVDMRAGVLILQQ